jgi:hypothetical protein
MFRSSRLEDLLFIFVESSKQKAQQSSFQAQPGQPESSQKKATIDDVLEAIKKLDQNNQAFQEEIMTELKSMCVFF